MVSDQTTDGSFVTVDGTVLPRGAFETAGFVAINQSEAGAPDTDTALGATRLEPGVHSDVEGAWPYDCSAHAAASECGTVLVGPDASLDLSSVCG